MRTNIQEIIDAQPTQHSLDWYRVRLGKFTGSQVGRLMKKGRGKDAEWSADAITYIKKRVAERMLNPSVVMLDDLFEEYLLQHTPTSKAMAWGNEQEMNARGIYAKTTSRKVTSCGAIEVSPYFASSPDGLCIQDNGTLEIKCPDNDTHTLYLIDVHSAEDLKAVRPEYYWQCISHMMVTDADWCDWVSYCPFNQKPLHIVRIMRDPEAEAQLRERIEAAEVLAQEMIEKTKCGQNISSCHSL